MTGQRSARLLRLADAVLQPGFVGTMPPAWVRRRLAVGLGGVALFSRNIIDLDQVAALTAALRAENPDVVVAVDEEAGDVTRFESRTGSSRPGNLALGAVDDPELTAAVAHDLGCELAVAGITLNYAPDADVNSNADNPVIGVRSFGAIPDLVARQTAAWVRGLQSAGVAACAKHFPGHGNTSTDSHHSAPVIDASRAELAACELVPFRAAIDAGVQAIMSAHLYVPSVDPDHPATLSRALLTDLLRTELGFDGVVVTDAIEMAAIAARYGLAGSAVRALAAGADAICVGGETADEETVAFLREAIVDAVTTGNLTEERLADAAVRVANLARWTSRQQTSRQQTSQQQTSQQQTSQQQTSRQQASQQQASQQRTSQPRASQPQTTDGQSIGPAVGERASRLGPRHGPDGGTLALTNGGNGNNGGGNGSLGLAAARRAVRVSATADAVALLPLRTAPHVVEFVAAGNMAIGPETPWGIAEPLAGLLPGTTTVRVGVPDLDTMSLSDVALAPAVGRPLVLVVRDAHRHGWMSDALRTLLAARPDAIVVEMGVPASRAGQVYLATYGASRACGQAAAEVLAGTAHVST